MKHLSQSWSGWLSMQAGKPPSIAFDVLVIGSGYGGAVAALRLAEKGHEVVLLERGSEYRPGDFPNDLGVAPKHFRAPSPDGRAVTGRATGLYELRAGPGVISMLGNGLGGGSLINAGVLLQPDADVFAQDAWPPELRSEAGGLAAHFQTARAMLGEHSAQPMAGLRKARALDALGAGLVPPRSAQAVNFTIDPQRCIRCGDCASGCNVAGAKLTLRDTYLRQACAQRALLLNSATVYSIARAAGGGWRIRVLPTESIARFRSVREAAQLVADHGVGVDVHARLVVIAAGTFGSTELLQRSKALEGERLWFSPALGSRLSANGDSLSFCANQTAQVNAIGIGADTWQPHAAATAAAVSAANVGPTITRMLDLRTRPSNPAASDDGEPPPERARPALEHRLVVQEGAVPGAIGRLFAELLATAHAGAQLGSWVWNAPRDAAVERLSAGHWLRGPGAGGVEAAARNAASLPQHTQTLLTMGHDGSAGRILWVQDRDASVPYWEDPAGLETYRCQERVLTRACKAVGGVWTPNPAWRFLPASVVDVLSGPKPAHFITTVHPLGGCPMGDDPRTSVVDHLGRVWAMDEALHPTTENERVYTDLFVLDGSIVPTSLGCNPMLTITALAERAMAALPLAALPLISDVSPAPPAAPSSESPARPELAEPADPADPAEPRPVVRAEPPVLPVELGERLVCKALPVEGALAAALGHIEVCADIDFALIGGDAALNGVPFTDWLTMWDDPKHRLVVKGVLRMEVTPQPGTPLPGAPTWVTYEVMPETSQAELLAAGWQPAVWRWIDALPFAWLRLVWHSFEALWHGLAIGLGHSFHLGRTLCTWLILRWATVPARPPEQAPLYGFRIPLKTLRRVADLLRGWLQASELRSMKYSVMLRLSAAQSVDPLPAGLPQHLRLTGSKRIDYAATWSEIAAWRRQRREQRGSDAAPPLLRAAFVEQISHLWVALHDADTGRPVSRPAWFLMDFKETVGRLPLRLTGGGDLPSAMAALSAYLLVFGRFALKTRMFDFRLPEYSGNAQPDAAPPRETELRLRRHGVVVGRVQAEAIDFTVPLGVSSSDPPDIDPGQRIGLRLWRYRRPAGEGGCPEVRAGTWHSHTVRKARSVLLVHAFAQSGYSFTLKSVHQNLAEALFEAGWEVWVLDHRLSTRLAAHRKQSTIDQIAAHDIPAAVDEMIRRIEADVGHQAEAPLQVFAFAQCIGAAATMMALLSGRLSYGKRVASKGPPPLEELPPSHLPKLAGLFNSQTHPFCIGAPLTQARTWVPAMIRDALGRGHVPFAVRGPQAGAIETLLDRVFMALPLPSSEQCPPRRAGDHDEDDCATCRRLRFLEAPLFKHANLSYETHRELPLLFGDANVRLFAHAAKCVNAERLVNEDGAYAYVHDDRLLRHMALPVCFLHGAENELFDKESAQRSAMQYARVHPQWANEVAAGLAAGPPAVGGVAGAAAERAAWLVPGYGHLDVLIAADAASRVFPGVVAGFGRWYALDSVAPPVLTARHAAARVPLSGPWVGAVRRVGAELRVAVSFRIDDRFSDGKHGPRAAVGSRTWAFARVSAGAGSTATAQILPLAIRNIRAPESYLGATSRTRRDFDALRIAHGELTIAAEIEAACSGLQIECFSVHEAIVAPSSAPARDLKPLHPALDPAAAPRPDTLSAWLNALLDARKTRLGEFAQEDRPARQTVSYFRLKPESFDARLVRIAQDAIDALAPRAGADADADAEAAANSVNLALGSCRYPGFAFERRRVDCWVGDFEAANADRPAAFGVLLGDQIYADATAGFADELNPTERFFERHRRAFARQRAGRTDRRAARTDHSFGGWLATLPVVMTPDDHEFFDAFPDGPPLVKASPARIAGSQHVVTRAARDAVRAYQQDQSAPLRVAQGAVAFSAGPLRVLVLDTRSRRLPRQPGVAGRVLRPAQVAALHAWLSDPEANLRLNVIATGSVVLPGLRLQTDPADPGPIDTFQACALDRALLFKAITDAHDCSPERFRVLLVSGDYHLTAAAELRRDGSLFGACIVAPPLYSPMPFLDAAQHRLWFDEPLPHGLALVAPGAAGGPIASWRGSGLAHLAVGRSADPARRHGYDVELRARLRAPEQYESAPTDLAVGLAL